MKKNFSLLCVSALACAALTGCGGAPSESDMKEAILRQAKNDMAQMEKAGGGGAFMKALMPEIKDVKKIGCKEDGEKAYRCDLEIEAKMNDQVRKGATTMRFVKGSDGWVPAK